MFDPFVSEWTTFVKSPSFTLIEKLLKTAQTLEYPDLDINKYVLEVSRIGASFKESTITIRDTSQKISLLNKHLFTNLGFTNQQNIRNIDGNMLNRVLDIKIGTPITLAIIYTNTAKYTKLDLDIVQYGSNILIQHDEILFDVLQSCPSLLMDDIANDVTSDTTDVVKYYTRDDIGYESIVGIYDTNKILIHLLHNLKRSYAEFYSYDKSMLCVNMILGIAPYLAEDIRDKGILEDRLLNFASALSYLEKYLEIEPDADDADFVLDLIQDIRQKINR